MSRRKPAAHLEASGTFRKNPAMRRTDPERAPFAGAPEWLTPAELKQFELLVSRMPARTLVAGDEISVAVTARLIQKVAEGASDTKTVSELRAWLGKLGMTPGDRQRINAEPLPGKKNAFAEFAKVKK